MAFTQALPEWLKTGVAPAAPKRAAGWEVEEHPPAEWFNWQWNLTFLALQELQQNAAHLDGTGTFTGPIKSSVAQGTAPLVVASNTLVANLNADRVDGMDAATAATASTVAARDASGDLTARVLKSGVATGTAPLTVASTTVVTNLNADMVDGLHTATASTANSVAARDGNGDLTARRFISNVAAGTAPFSVTSSTVVANLNADSADGYHFDQDVRTGASPSFVRPAFTQAAGTSPFTVVSNTVVANLNADLLDGLNAATAATANTVAARDASGNVNANVLVSTVASGTAPLTVTSTTVVPNLNADTVDGWHMNQDVRSTASPTFVTPTVTRLVSTQATGTAPFTVASQTVVTNLNADLFDGYQAGNASGNVPVSNGAANVNLNADMLDGRHASEFYQFEGGGISDANAITVSGIYSTTSTFTGSPLPGTDGANQGYLEHISWGTNTAYCMQRHTPVNSEIATRFRTKDNGTWGPWREIWDSGNDGSGSGLDADMVDGLHISYITAATTVAARDGSGDLTARGYVSTAAVGTVPFTVTSTTMSPNLNADMVDGYHLNQDVRSTASPTFVTPTVTRLVSTQATGTAPFTVASQTLVTNLNADMVDGLQTATAATVNTVAARDASGDLTSRRFISNVATGTAPLAVTSTTVVANLNADMLDGYNAGNGSGQIPINNGTLNTNLNADLLDGMQSGNASGNVPVSNGTVNTNLNADMLDGNHASAFVLNSSYTAWINQALKTTDSPSFVDIYTSGKVQAYNWGTFSSNSGGLAMLSDNAYAHPTDGTFRYRSTHASLGARGILIDWSTSGAGTALTFFENAGAATQNLAFTPTKYKIWHANNDGSGSGLDADMVDGYQASQLAKSRIMLTAAQLNNTLTDGGMYVTQEGSGMGLPGDWYHVAHFRHASDDGYAGQLALQYYGTGEMYWRAASATTWGAWKRIRTDSNTVVSSSAPSGGQDGDIWVQYTP